MSGNYFKIKSNRGKCTQSKVLHIIDVSLSTFRRIGTDGYRLIGRSDWKTRLNCRKRWKCVHEK